MPQAEAAAQLLSPQVNWKKPAAIKHRLQLLHALFDAVPCQRLEFPKDKGAVVRFLTAEGYL
jgi:hypothetical protein